MRGFVCFAFVCIGGTVFAATPIAGVTAKATSQQVEKLFDPVNVCNDSGLSDSGKGDGSQAFTTNGYVGGGCMWHSGYLALGPDEHPIIEFDLGKPFDVGRFHVWNHNGNPSRGFRQVATMISDDGKTWRAVPQRFQFAVAPKRDDYLGEDHEFVPAIRARFIRFHCESTHRQGGNPELAGLGKVRFYPAEKPAPNAASNVGAGFLPDGSGIVNVKHAPYSAKGDGTSDDTVAIQRAIDDWQGTHRTILIPAGTYLLSRTLRYKPANGHGYNNLRGVGETKTILKLRDGTFTDPKNPQPVLTLGFNGQADGKGVHADWFNNNVSDLRIDTGNGNVGAVGLQYYSNNVGALRDVAILSADGQGVVGLDLGYADQNGPCLVKNITVDGFATGVRTGAMVNSQTAERITVKNATKVGWENNGQCLAIRGLKVSGSGAGFVNHFGVVALIDSEFTGKGEAAITTRETLFARNITTNGYRIAIENKRANDNPTRSATGPTVEEWVSTPPLTLFPTANPRSLNLPIQETPDVPWGDPATWANIRAFRQLTDPDDSLALQRAIDSGAATVYFPAGGSFFFGEPVELRGKVTRIIGQFAGVNGAKGKPAEWRFRGDGPSVVVIQDLNGQLNIEHAAKRTLVVKNGQGIGGRLIGGGDLYLENITADWSFAKGREWARQFNNETEGTHIVNEQATLWILGLKTERGGTLIDSRAGSSTEVIGGLSYTTTKGKLASMFKSTDARVSYTIA